MDEDSFPRGGKRESRQLIAEVKQPKFAKKSKQEERNLFTVSKGINKIDGTCFLACVYVIYQY